MRNSLKVGIPLVILIAASSVGVLFFKKSGPFEPKIVGPHSSGLEDPVSTVTTYTPVEEASAPVGRGAGATAPGAKVRAAAPSTERNQHEAFGESASEDNPRPVAVLAGKDAPAQTDGRTTGKTRNPIPISPLLPKNLPVGLDQLMQAHRELEEEDTDQDWAPQMEQAISQFVARQPEASSVDMQVLACRTTRCELQMSDVKPSDPSHPAFVVASRMRAQPWYAQQLQERQFFLSRGADRMLVFFFVERR